MGLSPGLSRLPLPPSVIDGVIEHVCAHMDYEAGAAVKVMTCFYLRPGECFRLRRGSLIPPGQGSGLASTWSLILHEQEEGVSSKVKEFDDGKSTPKAGVDLEDEHEKNKKKLEETAKAECIPCA